MNQFEGVLEKVNEVKGMNSSREAMLERGKEFELEIMLLEALDAVREVELSIYDNNKERALAKCKEVMQHFRGIVKRAAK